MTSGSRPDGQQEREARPTCCSCTLRQRRARYRVTGPGGDRADVCGQHLALAVDHLAIMGSESGSAAVQVEWNPWHARSQNLYALPGQVSSS